MWHNLHLRKAIALYRMESRYGLHFTAQNSEGIGSAVNPLDFLRTASLRGFEDGVNKRCNDSYDGRQPRPPSSLRLLL